MRAVNLLPDGGRQSRPPILTTTTVVIGGAVLLGVVWIFLGVSFFQAHGRVSDRKDTLASLQQQVSKVEAARAAKAAAVVATSSTNQQGRVAAFDSASSARLNWDNLLEDISHVLPRGSWISSLTMQGPSLTPSPAGTPAATAAPAGFSVAGVALSQNVVAQVMQRLALIPALSNITLTNSSRADLGSTRAYTFSMTATINAPQVAQ